MSTEGVVLFMVNEEGVTYAEPETYEEALAWLDQYPNDTIVVATVGSPSAKGLREGWLA